ncbi:MAG: F0F1 ATP synthase subunit B [FCB group bacterium]|nr:F0F1 ATP synthase subunit B [FCB group bacterium]
MTNPLVQPDPGLFIWTIITFLVLFFLLAKFAWKPLLAMLEKREETIRKSLEDAEKAKQELERLQQESEAIIAKARNEAQKIVAEGKVIANRLRDEVLEKTKGKADAILKNAEKQIQMEKEKAIKEIKTEVVDLSIQIAGKLIEKNLSKDDNLALIRDSLQSVKTIHEA